MPDNNENRKFITNFTIMINPKKSLQNKNVTYVIHDMRQTTCISRKEKIITFSHRDKCKNYKKLTQI